MAKDIWAGRCRDCFFDGVKLFEMVDPRLAMPFVHGMPLCRGCYDSRQTIASLLQPRPFGIPADLMTAKWVDLNPMTVRFVSAPEVHIEVKFRMPTIAQPTLYDGGEVRMRIADNPYWEAASFVNCEGRNNPMFLQKLARSTAKLMVHYRFEPYLELVC